MARAKDEPYLNRLFEGPAGGERAAESGEDARARAALRREVLGIMEAAGEETAPKPLDDGLIAAYLDDALEAPERAALDARLAVSATLREQVSSAALSREAGLKSGLAMPPAFTADYDAVPGPAKPAGKDASIRPAGPIGRLFGAPMPARRWLAATLPVLAVAVVVAVIGPRIIGERSARQSDEGTGARLSTPAADAEAKRKRMESKRGDAEVKRERAQEKRSGAREAGRARRAAPARPAEAAKPKPVAPPKTAERPGGAGVTGGKAGSSARGKELAILNTTVVPLNSELRDAVVILGQSQLRSSFAAPAKKDEKRRTIEPNLPSTGSRADRAAREPRADKPGAGLLAKRPAVVAPRHIDVINRAVAPDCIKDPAACCGSHRVDRDLLNRLLTSEPLQSVKVLHLSSRACYLTLP